MSGVDCVYYWLKASIFVDVDDLWITGRSPHYTRQYCYQLSSLFNSIFTLKKGHLLDVTNFFRHLQFLHLGIRLVYGIFLGIREPGIYTQKCRIAIKIIARYWTKITEKPLFLVALWTLLDCLGLCDEGDRTDYISIFNN